MGPVDAGNVMSWMQYSQWEPGDVTEEGAETQPRAKPERNPPAGDPWVEIFDLDATAGSAAGSALFRKYAREGRLATDLPEHARAWFEQRGADEDFLNRVRRVIVSQQQGGADR